MRESYYQEWAAELDAYFLDAAERPLTRLYWSLRFPGPLLMRALTIARVRDPDVFSEQSNWLVRLGGSRTYGIFFWLFGIVGSGSLTWTAITTEQSLAWTILDLTAAVLLQVVVESLTILRWAISVLKRESVSPRRHKLANAVMAAWRVRLWVPPGGR